MAFPGDGSEEGNHTISDVLCEVCVSQILDHLDGAELGRLECTSRRWRTTCTNAWSNAFERRYGRACVLPSTRDVDYRREYAIAARGDPGLLSWRRARHVDDLYRCRSRRPAVRGLADGSVAIFGEFLRASRVYEVGIAFVHSNSWSFVKAPFAARDGADLRALEGGRDLLVHGGCLAEVGARVAESWVLLERREWRRIHAPADAFPTVHHSFEVVNSKFAVRFGGQRWDGEPLDDCVVFDRRTSRAVSSFPHPPARALHASCVVDDDKLLVAGGIRADGVGTLHDAWLLECRESWRWTKVALGGDDDDRNSTRATRGWAVVRGSGKALGGAPLALTAEYNVAFGLWRCELHYRNGLLYLCGDGGVATFVLDTSTPRIDGRLVPVAKNFVTVVDSPPSRPAPLLDAAHVLFGKSILVSFGGNDGNSDTSWYDIAGHGTDRAAFVDLRNIKKKTTTTTRLFTRSTSSSGAALVKKKKRHSCWHGISPRNDARASREKQPQPMPTTLGRHFTVSDDGRQRDGLVVVSLCDLDGRIEVDHLEWRPHSPIEQ